MEELGVEHRFTCQGFATPLGHIIASIFFLWVIFKVVLTPVAEHSFFIKAIEKMYQVRTKDRDFPNYMSAERLMRSSSRRNSSKSM